MLAKNLSNKNLTKLLINATSIRTTVHPTAAKVNDPFWGTNNFNLNNVLFLLVLLIRLSLLQAKVQLEHRSSSSRKELN